MEEKTHTGFFRKHLTLHNASTTSLVVYRYLFSLGLVILFETMFRYLPSTFPTIPVMNVKQCIIVIGMMYWYGFRLGNKHKSNQS